MLSISPQTHVISHNLIYNINFRGASCGSIALDHDDEASEPGDPSEVADDAASEAPLEVRYWFVAVRPAGRSEGYADTEQHGRNRCQLCKLQCRYEVHRSRCG